MEIRKCSMGKENLLIIMIEAMADEKGLGCLTEMS